MAPKRLCIFSDGTWKSAEVTIPTNIYHLATSVSLQDSFGHSQLVFYDAGVGTANSLSDKILGGAIGHGLDKNIIELYTVLAMNYTPGDEVYLFGFSRGAYTVRSLAGLIYNSGLVRRDQLDWVKEAYDLYRAHSHPSSKQAVRFRHAHGGRIPIKALVCFDTVGALGIPDSLPWPLGLLATSDRYTFHDTTLSSLIENAVHILSIDEDRRAYLPTLMKCSRKRGRRQVTQIYMPGSHGGVGGGKEREKGFSETALWFVVGELKKRGCGIVFHEQDLPRGGRVILGGRKSFRHVATQRLTGVAVRDIPSLKVVHESAVRRYIRDKQWRPLAMKKFEGEILRRKSWA